MCGKNNDISSHSITFCFKTYDPSVDETNAIVYFSYYMALLLFVTDTIALIKMKYSKNDEKLTG